MTTIGATLTRVEAGEVVIEVPHREDLTQQHGFLHAGVIASIADSACGYAAFTLMPEDHAVLSVEFKQNLLAPAKGERFRATARVVKAGRTLTVCTAEVVAVTGAEETLVAVMLLVTSGSLRSLAALVLLVEVVLLATVPRLRWFAFRAWLYWEQPFLWYVLEQDRILGPLPRERDEDDLHRGDHLP